MFDKDAVKKRALEAWGVEGLKVAPAVLSPEQIVDIVVDALAAELESDIPAKTLGEYTQGEPVTVLFDNGDWIPGFVTEVTELSNNVHVHTDKGPKTIGNMNRIKPVR